jgi:predicted transcriptional regulator
MLWANDRSRFWLIAFLFLPLYTRISKDFEQDLVQQSNRGRIYQYIKDCPGVALSEIKQSVETGNGTTVYHLKVMEKGGSIIKKGTRYFIKGAQPKLFNGMDRPMSAREANIVHVLTQNRGLSEGQLCNILSEKQSTINRALKHLLKYQVVVRKTEGRTYQYSLSTSYAWWASEQSTIQVPIQRTCPSCGSPLPGESVAFCSNCGYQIQ